MDKLKVFFGKLKKHHFWVLTGLVLIMATLMWYMATGSLADEYKTNRAKIEGEFSELSKIVGTTEHPNKTFEAGTQELERDLRKDVDRAWTRVFNDQKSKVLKWPKELGEEFLAWMDDPANYKSEIDEDFRDSYWNYVKEEFPNLLKIVDARPYWDKEEDEMGGGMGGVMRRRSAPGPAGRARTQMPKREYKVIWDKKNQQPIDESLEFPKGRPTSQQVRFCQENLWVYRALLEAIADVNQGATGHHNAKIKQIIGINIGQDASQLVQESLAPGRIMSVDGAMANQSTMMTMSMPMGEGGMPAGAPPMMEGGERGGPMGTGSTDGRKPLDDKRYVDEKGIPMPSGTTGPEEFKRMPILMRLFMDQREIANLLVRLANSPLPVEIRQLRVNTKMQGFSNPRMVMFGGGQEAGGAMGGRGGAAQIKRDKAFEEASQSPYDVAVELHGIIYIFNPPNPELMAAVENAELAEEAAAATPAEPAATTDEASAEPPESKGGDEAAAATGDKPSEENAGEAPPDNADAKPEANGDAPKAKVPSEDVGEFQQSAPADAPPVKEPVEKKPAKEKPEDEAPFGESS